MGLVDKIKKDCFKKIKYKFPYKTYIVKYNLINNFNIKESKYTHVFVCGVHIYTIYLYII